MAKKEEKPKVHTDPVCHMEVEEENAAATSKYKGKTYYFCCEGCKEEFDRNPGAYA